MDPDQDDIYWDNVLDQPPIEFFEAAEKGKEAVSDYLESNRPFTLYTRMAMALWLRGELKLPKGRPPLHSRSEEASKKLRMALAVHEYHREREAIRASGARVRGTAEETQDRIAQKYRIPLNQFEAQLRRGKKTVKGRSDWGEMAAKDIVLEMYAEWQISRNK